MDIETWSYTATTGKHPQVNINSSFVWYRKMDGTVEATDELPSEIFDRLPFRRDEIDWETYPSARKALDAADKAARCAYRDGVLKLSGAI